MGVYASATFTPPGAPRSGTINSNDVKKKVFNSPSTLATLPESQQSVGDGKLIKIDLIAPVNAAMDNLVVSRGDDELTGDEELKAGDEIDIVVNVGDQTRFRDGSILVTAVRPLKKLVIIALPQ